MKDQLEKIKVNAVILFTAEIVIALILEFGFRVRYASFILLFVVVDALFLAFVMHSYSEDEAIRKYEIKEIVSENMADAIQFGDVGIVTYNQEYMITWMSDLFIQREVNYVGEKVTMWLPDINQLFKNEVDEVTVEFEGYRYLVTRLNGEQVLFFKDITDFSILQKNYHDEQVVVGMIHMDNYSDVVQYEDEQKIALINTNLRQKVLDWCVKYHMFVRRVRSDRFLVVLNESDYEQAVANHFSILYEIRKEAQNMDVAITLSMAFARGTSDYLELDKMVNELLEFAQNRGGDQVATRKYGEDVKVFGGSSEAQEKRSRVRVRVMAKTIHDMIESSSRVFIIGHKDMDFDCMGAALGMSRIASSIQKEVYIVLDEKSIERKLEQTLYRINQTLVEYHTFIPVDEALSLMDKDSLIIAVDHHSVGLSIGEKLLEHSKQTMIVDHHRRRSDDNINATMVYVETSASSTTELVTELLQYQPEKLELTSEEVNVMFAGMLVDTNHFRTRSGSRTFEAAAQLRKMGADPMVADDMLKDTYKEFEMRTQLVSYSEEIYDDIVVSAIDNDHVYNRTLLSKAAEYLLQIQNIEASFVIAKVDQETVAISARSNGEINVQLIMEKMNGGGHFTAAALQRKQTTVEEIKEELLDTIDSYFKEVKEHESNLVK
ncbi:MAG: DHH family phosphoesterase [Erysipelotrichaceae bacterium]|nr:DHH family phosphoesterase [Erysipelotrichaceae bacterium]